MRTEYLEGRKHVVVPVTFLIEGVLRLGSGATYFPAWEIAVSTQLWNGRHLLVDHPRTNNLAGSPEVMEQQRIGILFNSQYDAARLGAEAWVDVERAQQVDPRVLRSIKRGEVMEVSMFATMNYERRTGKFNGQEYHVVAHAIRPDHVSVLPDDKGDCSVANGAGLGVAVAVTKRKARTQVPKVASVFDQYEQLFRTEPKPAEYDRKRLRQAIQGLGGDLF